MKFISSYIKNQGNMTPLVEQNKDKNRSTKFLTKDLK
jgi:hypothetical protein